MRSKTEFEMAVTAAKKAVRSATRLRYSIMADMELNETLPELEREMTEALEKGKAFELDPARYFRGLPS